LKQDGFVFAGNKNKTKQNQLQNDWWKGGFHQFELF
jgi:hypothetical protein